MFGPTCIWQYLRPKFNHMKTLTSTLIFLFVMCGAVIAQTEQHVYSGNLSYTNESVEWSEADQTYVTATLTMNGQLQLIKTATSGVIVWSQCYQIGNGYLSGAADMVILSDGGIFVAGYYNYTGMVEYYLMRVHAWGDPDWAKTYATNSMMTYWKPSLTLLPDGNFMITESVYGHVGFIKVNPAGTLISSTVYRENPGNEAKTPGFASDIFPDGSMIFTGKRDCDILMVKTDMYGQIQWSKVLNADPIAPGDSAFPNYYYHTKDVVALNDGSSIMVGFENYVGFLMRVSSAGGVMWYKSMTFDSASFSGSAYYEVEQLDANTFIAAGYNTSPFLTKFDINGNIISSIKMDDSTGGYFGWTVEVNSSGQIMWPVYSIAAPVSAYVFNFLNSFTPNGCEMSAVNIPFESSPVIPMQVSCPIFQVSQSIVENTVTVTTMYNIINYGDLCTMISVVEPENNVGLTIRNTLLDQSTLLYFSLGDYAGDITYTITDMSGRIIASETKVVVSQEVVSVDDQFYSAGMYVLTVQAGENAFSEKFGVRE